MNRRKDEEWLDDELRQVIGQTDIQFNVEVWKQDHTEAYQALLARGVRHEHTTISRSWKNVLASHVGKFAVAAAIVVAGSLALLAPRPETNRQVTPPRDSALGEITTFKSLTLAYRRGGEEALNRQLDRAQEALGPRPDQSLLSDLWDDLRS
jgi:hypothetical protein